MIPEAAVEAAAFILVSKEPEMLPIDRLRLALEAAAPHMFRSAADTIVANCPLDDCAPAVRLLREWAK